MNQTTELLSSYACSLGFDDLSPSVVHQVKRTLIDSLGCAVGGFSSEPALIARRLGSNVTSTRPSRVLGTRDHSSPDLAAFTNGVMLRYLDCNDSYFSPGGGHPSDMIPAALAFAPGGDGPSVITAIALAYEVFCGLSDRVAANDFGWDQGIFCVIGAACAAGKMMGLDREKMGHAISLAVAPNLPLGVTRTGEISMWKGCATAGSVRAGVFAAQLAQEGMTGPFEPFEGRRGLWAQAVGRPVDPPCLSESGREFRICRTTFKSFPSQIHTQGPIGLALDLRPQIDVDRIESVRLESYRQACSDPSTEPEKWDPKTRETADHSIPFLVAAALQHGPVTPATFTPEGIRDPALRHLIGKMSIRENERFTQKYPAEYNCRLEITQQPGQVFTAETAYPKGHRSNPLSDSEVEDKFRNLASGLLSRDQCAGALDAAWSLDRLPDIDQLYDSLVI